MRKDKKVYVCPKTEIFHAEGEQIIASSATKSSETESFSGNNRVNSRSVYDDDLW